MRLSEATEHLQRYKDLALLLFKYGDSDLVRRIGLDNHLDEVESPSAELAEKAEELPDDLEKLGPTYVKFGQFLSTRPDLLPQVYVDALERLQDDVEEIPYAEVSRIITEELGVRPEKLFVEFDEKPLGSASLGQTHRAVLRSGRVVVVKVQRPDIRARVTTDLDAFSDIAQLLQEKTETGKRFMIEATVEEFRAAMLAELDYRREAENLARLDENLREFPRILVPRPIADLTTSKVLVMEFVEGRKVTAIGPIGSLEIDGEGLADELLKAYLKQIFVDGFYHADPHPGNVFITSLGDIALLDLGMVARLPRNLRPDLLRLLIAVSDGDGDRATDSVIRLGKGRREFDEQGLRTEITRFVASENDRKLGEMKIGSLVLGLTALASDNGIRLPNEFVMIGKTLMNLDRIGIALAPNFQPSRAIERHLAEIMQRERTADMSLSSIYDAFVETKQFAEELPGRANRILDALAKNEFSVRAEVIDEEYFMFGLQKIANRLTIGLVLAALIIGAALMTRVETSFTIFGYPGIAILFFLVAGLLGLGLVWRIMMHDVGAATAKNRRDG